MKKKSERVRLTKRLDDLCREIIRARDNNVCQRCNKYVVGSNSQPSHVIAKGRGASIRRFDLLNIYLSCNPCHRWWHLNPTESGKWFAEKWPHRDSYLNTYRGGNPTPISTPDMRDLVITLKEKFAELQNCRIAELQE